MSRALVRHTEKYVRMEDANNHGNCYPNCWDRINEKIITEREKNRTHLPRTGHGRGRRSYCGGFAWLLFLVLICVMDTIEGSAKTRKIPNCVYTGANAPAGEPQESFFDRSCGIRQLVDQWVGVGGNAATVTATYGTIANWDTSLVTDMSHLFDSFTCGNRFTSFNENLASWNTSKVTTLQHST